MRSLSLLIRRFTAIWGVAWAHAFSRFGSTQPSPSQRALRCKACYTPVEKRKTHNGCTQSHVPTSISSRKWMSHLQRDWTRQEQFFTHGVDIDLLSTQFAWPAILVHHFGPAWLEQHRVQIQNNGRMESRLYRRCTPGNVQARWAEATVDLTD